MGSGTSFWSLVRRQTIPRFSSAATQAKAAAAQAYVRKQKEIAKEKLRKIESQVELQRKLLKSKVEAERVRLEAELELEKQRSISEEAQKARELELEVIRLDVEAEALEKEAHDPNSLQERLNDFEGEDTIPAYPNQENVKEIKPVEVPENPIASDVAYMSTLTPKPKIKHQQLKVTFHDKEKASNK